MFRSRDSIGVKWEQKRSSWPLTEVLSPDEALQILEKPGVNVNHGWLDPEFRSFLHGPDKGNEFVPQLECNEKTGSLPVSK
jgi:hypothetical protein